MIDVYCHTSPSGKRYVGYSKHGMAERWRQHVEAALAGGGYLLHRAIRKYGADAFRHELLEQSDTEAGAKSAVAMPAETRARINDARRGCKHGPEARTRQPRSAEVRAKISAARRGKPWTAAQHAARAKKAG